MLALGLTLGQGIFWSVFGAIVAFPAVMYGLIAVHEVRERMRQPVDYERWRRVPVLQVWMAASLWADRSPTTTITPRSTIYPYLQQLKGAIETKALESESAEANMNARVRREALVRYAKSVGESPRFLEPEVLD